MKLKQAIFTNLFWKLVGVLFLFFNNLLVVRILGAEFSGQLFFTIAYLMLFVSGLRVGLETGIVYLNTRTKVNSAGLFFFFIPLVILQAEIVIAVLKFIPEAKQIFPTKLATIYIVSNVAINYLSAFYSSKRMFRSYNLIHTIFQILLAGVLFIIYRFSLDMGPKSYAWLCQVTFRQMAILSTLTSIYLAVYYYYANRQDFKVISISKATVIRLFKLSYLIYISNILFYLITRADLYFVNRYSTALELGNYVQSGKFGQMMMMLPYVLASVIFPYSVQSDRSFPKKVALICKVIAMLFTLIFFAVLLVGKFLFPWLLGQDFTLVYPILLAIIPGVLFYGINQILISYFEGKNRQRVVLIASLIHLVILLLLNIIFAPKYGYMACAVVFSISCFFTNLLLTRHFLKATGLSLKEAFSLPVSEIRNFKLSN